MAAVVAVLFLARLQNKCRYMLWYPCTIVSRLPLKRRLWRVLQLRQMVTLFSEQTLLGRTLVRPVCLSYRQPLPWVVAYNA